MVGCKALDTDSRDPHCLEELFFDWDYVYPALNYCRGRGTECAYGDG